MTTTTSPHLPDKNFSEATIEVIPTQSEAVASEIANELRTKHEEEQTQQPEPKTVSPSSEQTGARGGGLSTTRGTFRSFLAPLTQEKFKEVVTDVQQKLVIVNQTLSSLLEDHSDAWIGFDAILEEMLSSITAKTGELLNADRTTIFLLDDDKDELYTTVAKEGGGTVEIRVPTDKGIAGEVATFKKVVNIPFDFHDDPRSAQAKIQFKNTGYRTYTMLALPLLSDKGDLVAVIQLINKLKKNAVPSAPLAERIDLEGFTEHDEQVFREFAPSIRLILESSRSFYTATQKQRAAQALIQATQSLSKSSLDLEATLKNVMDEAKKLMNADRSTLWLIDPDRNQLWTKVENADGSLRELRLPKDAGFAGQVATSGEPLLIPFDLYDHPNSQTSKETDRKTGYRTCSMLCMPVFNADGELIGVTQLVNKVKQGDYPDYDPANYPEAPERWKASFNRTDMEFMATFNIQAGVALQNAKLFETVRQQELMQRDILRSLTNGVISTNKQGIVIAANESAKAILGLSHQETLEGKPIKSLIKIQTSDFPEKSEFFEKNDFPDWVDKALEGKDEKSRNQYYYDRILEAQQGEQHSINLSVNTIADVNDSKRVSGVLVVMEDISDEKRLKSTMSRYMSEAVVQQLFENPDAANLAGVRRNVSVLFSDIRSYTTITETLSADEVVKMLNQYFEEMVEAVFRHKGTLDKYIGDAIMAVFGSPLPLDDHEFMAVKTALEMRQRLKNFNEAWVAQDPKRYKPIQIGIGINSDDVISGNIGSSKRVEFTAIGDGVNLGSRLEGATKIYGTDIVISEYTYKPCADRVWARELDYIKVKGKDKPVKVYELVGLRNEPLSSEKEQIIEHYRKGREYYLSGNFPMAMAEFGTVLNINKDDKSASLHLSRCQYWLTHNLPENWDGSWTLTEK